MTIHPSYRGLPPLAGLSSMDRAIHSDWSVDQSVDRWKRLHFVLKRLHEILTQRITGEPIYELKTAFSHHAYICAEHVTSIRRRVSEMREPPLGLDKLPHAGLAQWMDEIEFAPTTSELLTAVYEHVLPEIHAACERFTVEAHPLADAPSVRIAKWIAFELAEIVQFGRQAIDCLVDHDTRQRMGDWLQNLHDCVASAGGLSGTEQSRIPIPPSVYAHRRSLPSKEPQRDERFSDPYNAGVNPEAFLYDERFSPRDKTLMMYYKRLRELDVPEMMATMLAEIGDEEPWDFHLEMSRQLWDEARHAMMGEVGFNSLGIDWSKIPINFTWSRNLNLQLTARQRHGVLFFIEQGLMPKTGKRYEWEVATKSGDPLSKLFQDFDWADEVLHAQIGRRWYVTKFGSLNEALAYGDHCWTAVLSHWQSYKDQGLTQHRNWWPELYKTACEIWDQPPDPAALAFCETYEDSRADLKKLSEK